MTLRFSDKWLWDFWFARDGSDYHIFYLQAPRSLDNPELRHWNVSIGHAVSQDLINWEVLPDALDPSPSPAWDDYTTWTGSVIKYGGLWHLFYTGTSRADQGLIQRIGLATSQDLIHWEKYPANPLIQADPRWYELLDLQNWHDQAWRDPFVFVHPSTGDFHAFITARVNHGPADQRGVIAHAQSKDLVHWEVFPPLDTPREFGQMEVPQLVNIKDAYYLIFSCGAEQLSMKRRRHFGDFTGSYYLYSKSPFGPFRYLNDTRLFGDAPDGYYSSKLIQGPDEKWYIMAFKNIDHHGSFVGEISSPMPLSVGDGGELSCDW